MLHFEFLQWLQVFMDYFWISVDMEYCNWAHATEFFEILELDNQITGWLPTELNTL